MKRGIIYGSTLILLLCTCGNVANNDKKSDTVSVKIEQQTEINNNVPKETEFYDITIEEALLKAKEEEKYVLIDCHTKSCGPCRKMEKTVFPSEKCGEYINPRFVPIMMDMESEIGIAIAKKYDVGIYPTYLVLSPDGKKQGEIIGAEFNVDDFIAMLKNILHEN